MKERDSEELLWELGRTARPETDGAADDETLRAYRAGELAAEEADALEALLARSPRARARLLELAGVAPEAAPLVIRRRVLAGFGSRRPFPAVRRGRGRSWLPLAAAALAASLVLVVGGPRLRPGAGLPAGLAYEVAVRGAAAERAPEPAGGPAAGPALVFAATEVEIVATPRDAAVAEVELALYRRTGQRLARLGAESGLEVEPLRGGAVFRGRAGDLLGPGSGERSLLLTIAETGDLPPAVTLEPGGDPESVLASGGRRLVYPLTFELRVGGELPAREERRVEP